jgi:hypothetical protein
VAAEKEDFLKRWSRLKKQTPIERPAETPKPSLPSVEELKPESDFSGFMHPKVEDALRRVALKKLFSGDPHFNLPDPFEPFSGDWTVGEPIPEKMLKAMNQARTLLLSDEEKQELAKQEAAAQAPAPEASAPEASAPEASAPEQAKSDEPGKQDA